MREFLVSPIFGKFTHRDERHKLRVVTDMPRRAVRLGAFVVFGALVVGLLCWSVARSGDDGAQARDDRSLLLVGSDKVLATSTLHGEVTVLYPGTLPEADPGGRSLAQALREQDDLRAFGLGASTHPELGGITYSIYAGQLCRRIKTLLDRSGLGGAAMLPYAPPEDPAAYAMRNAALQRALRACASYTVDELRATDPSQWSASGNLSGDLLYRLSKQSVLASRSEDSAARAEALQSVLDAGDPLLLQIALQRLVEPAGASELVEGLAIGSDADREAILRAVFDVVPCRFGLICDARDEQVLAACLQAQGCVDDRVELARQAIKPPLRPAFDEVLARLETAIREKQAGKLLP